MGPPLELGAAQPDSRARNRVQSVDRAVDILAELARAERSTSLRDVAMATGLNKATAYRMLATLEERGLVGREEATGFYTLGSEVTALAGARERQGTIVDRALPAMRRLRDTVDETVRLGVRSNDFRLRLHQLDSSQEVNRNQPGNRTAPLYAGAANVLLLSAMDQDEIDAYLARTDLVPHTPNTVSSRQQLWARISEMRERGYAVSSEESQLNGGSVAAPILDAYGRMAAVVYLSVPLVRFGESDRPRLIAATVTCGEEASHELGYRPKYYR